jgi:hypothetical protein
VPLDLRNHWSNCRSLGLNIKYSHIFRECNWCADKQTNEGHALTDYMWWASIPACIRDDFLHDKLGLPSYRIA